MFDFISGEQKEVGIQEIQRKLVLKINTEADAQARAENELKNEMKLS